MDVVIQCVPNFSEGRDERVIEAIVDAVRSAHGIVLADYSWDPDHNRLVVSILGEPSGVREAVNAGARKAVELIDLRRHSGQHPRIGAIDVVPLVPIRGITMSECVELSCDIGRDLATQIGLPVYFYECSAIRSHCKDLADVRRGGFERLVQLGMHGDRAPDLGPSKPHPTAGAVVVGARRPLVAYNVNLIDGNTEAATSIATKVRGRNGGLPGVKAMGVWLSTRSRAQVSMNVTRPDLVKLPQVFEFVSHEARQCGTEVAESEIIGLVPKHCLDGVTPSDIKAVNLKETQLLEYWLDRL